MKVSIYYAIDSGLTRLMTTTVHSGLFLYSNDDPDSFRRTCVDLVYKEISENGKIPVGKITILNVFIA